MDSSDVVLPLESGNDSKGSSLSPPPKPKTRAPRHTTIAMQAWLEANGNNMYPSREQKLQLASTVNLPYNQINRWFANRRRRHTPKCETQAQLIRLNQTRNKRSPTHSSDGDDMNEPAIKHIYYAAQSHLATTPPAIQSINPLLLQLQTLQHLPGEQSSYMQWLQQQAPWLMHIQQQQQQRLLFDDVIAAHSSQEPENSPNGTSRGGSHSPLEQEDTYQLFRRTAMSRNLTEAESLAVCALADMARATA